MIEMSNTTGIRTNISNEFQRIAKEIGEIDQGSLRTQNL
jgi:hypothetical protein